MAKTQRIDTLDRRLFLVRSAAGFAAVGAPARSIGRSPSQPNVVLILTDNLGRDLGCYGNPVIRTPNIDRLAGEGVRMTHAFCTTSSCSPSRSVVLTGLYAHANGMYGLAHAYHHFSSFEDVKSLPVMLSEGGYRTGLAGKLHVEPESVYRFDTTVEADSRNPVEMAERSRSFIDAADKPFFLYFCPYDPHRGRPFTTWPEPNPFGNRPDGYPGVRAETYDPRKVVVPSFLTDTPECRAEIAQYYQSISRVDQGVGRLVSILRETGKYDNTVVLLESDNGSAFPGALTTLYEPGMRLPCIVRSPFQERKGITCGAMINWADLAPTIADFAGLDHASLGFQGRSFRSVLETENPGGWDQVYASHTFHEVTMYQPMRVLRQRRYKLIWNIVHDQQLQMTRDLRESSTWRALMRRDARQLGKREISALLKRPEFELYDLDQDPDEINNLAAQPEFADRLSAMTRELREFQERTRDPWIISWEGHPGLKVIEKH